jgi:hypothetical protein
MVGYKVHINPELVMKSYQPMAVLVAVSTIALVSCEQPPRVVDRPLPGFNGTPYTNTETPSVIPAPDQTELLNQLQDPSSIGIDPNNQQGLASGNTGVNPGTGTIGQILANPGTTPSPTITPSPTVKTPVQTPKVNPVTPPVNPPKPANNESIQTAWPTEDPMVVFSPYDRTKKIRIQKPDGTRQAPGTIMRDPHFPDRKFIVP